jgi:16S rRNA (guanine1207-N2)-methyltransferase
MIRAQVGGMELRFETAPGLFSPEKLDPGSLAMLSCIDFEPNDKVLDLGCGYGVIGIYAAKLIGADRVWMLDNDPAAVACTRTNLALNDVTGITVLSGAGFENLRESGFTRIICNPPYHADFSVPKHFIEKGFNRLVVGGAIYLVTKRRRWYENKLRSIFGGSRIREVDSYFVFEAVKKSANYAAQG